MTCTIFGLSICTWNSNGLGHKMLELQDFCNKHQPDVILIQEHKLNNNINPKIPNYEFFKSDRPNSNIHNRILGGTGIFIKRCLSYHLIATPNFNDLEATAITINLKNLNPLTIVSTYIKCNATSFLLNELHQLLNLDQNIIICGDLNAHHTYWRCKNTNNVGKIIYDLSINEGLEIAAPPTPTRHNSYSSSTIDIALIKGFHYGYDIATLNELSSDHDPVLIIFNLNYEIPTNSRSVRTNWLNFTNDLINVGYNPSNANNGRELDDQINNLSNLIVQTYKNNSKPVNPNSVNFIPPLIKNLIKYKNRLKREWQRFKDPHIKKELNQIQARLRKTIHKHKQDEWSNYLGSLNTEDKSLYGAARYFKRNRSNIPSLNGPTSIANTDHDKAEVIADSLELQFQPNNMIDIQAEQTVTQTISDFRNRQHLNNTIQARPSMLIERIKTLKVNKAPGKEGITNKMVKNLPINIIFIFTNLINIILDLGHYPTEWKTAAILPILKPGKNPKIPVSYRPISLLPTLSKLAEFVIHDQMKEFLARTKLIIPQQFGFRPKLSTTHQLLRVTEYIKTGITKRKVTGAVFLDIAKAFDKVWIDALIHKMIILGFPDTIINIINSYLNDRHYVVRVKNTYSTKRNILSGVPQGSILGPTLFNIFMNDIPQTLFILLCMFADDTAILCQGRSINMILAQLKTYIKRLEAWFSKWKISINVEKCNAIIFTHSKNINPPPLMFYGAPIPWTHELKYLGVILDRKLTWNSHILSIIKKYKQMRGKYWPLITRSSKMTVDNKILIYLIYLRPIITYASPVFGYAAKTHIKKLEVLENSTLRTIANANWYMRNDEIRTALGIPNLKTFIKKISTSFFNNINNIDNDSLRELEIYDYNLPSNRKRPRAIML